MEFKVNLRDSENLAKMMSKIPNLNKSIIAKTLTKQASQMKFIDIPEALDDAFTIRNEKFMNRQIRYKKASLNKNPFVNYSEVGSIEAKGFTAWEEQQKGTQSEKDRVPTQAARIGNSWEKPMKRGARLKPGGSFRKTSDYSGKKLKTKAQRTWAMIFETRRQCLSFIISKTDSRPGRLFKLVPGLYGWVGKKLMRLQRFDTRYDPKKTDWMGNAVKKLTKRRGGFEAVFNRELRKALNAYKEGR